MASPDSTYEDDMAARASRMELRKTARLRADRIGFFEGMRDKEPKAGPPIEPKRQTIDWENDNKIEYRHKPSSRWDGGADLWAAQLQWAKERLHQEVAAPGNAGGQRLPDAPDPPPAWAMPAKRSRRGPLRATHKASVTWAMSGDKEMGRRYLMCRVIGGPDFLMGVNCLRDQKVDVRPVWRLRLASARVT